MTILSVPGKLAQSARVGLAAVFLASFSACAAAKGMFKPVSRPWPLLHDERLRRDGPDLRVTGASSHGAAAARQDALAALRSYLQRLDVRGEPAERESRIRAALRRAEPSPAPGSPGIDTAVIDVPLKDLQEILGTEYE